MAATDLPALIIAAGCGSRLSSVSTGRPKMLVSVLGVPIIDRVIGGLRAVGVREIVVTVGHGESLIRDHLGCGDRLGVHVRYAVNAAWADGNAGSVLAAREFLGREFLLVMGDHLIDERILAAMLDREVPGDVLAAVDPSGAGEDATHVLCTDGRIADIGKQIPVWTGTDIGVFRCSDSYLTALATLVPAGVGELAATMREVEVSALDISAIDPYIPKLRKGVAPWWVDIDTPTDLAAAEHLLIDNAAKNASDALAHWVHRPLENALVAPLARTGRITPNQVSIAVNILAYAVTALLATGALLAGSLLSFAVGLADGLDGKLARVTGRVTRTGALEHAFDMLYEYSWILALAWAIHDTDDTATPLLLAGITVTLVAFYRSIYDHYGKQAGHSLDDSSPFARHFRRIAGRRNLYNIWILAGVLAGAPLFSLYAIAIHAAVTATVYSAQTIVLLRRLDAAASSPLASAQATPPTIPDSSRTASDSGGLARD